MYIARDKDGTLNLFMSKPRRGWKWTDYRRTTKTEHWVRDYKGDCQVIKLDSSLYPEISWDDEPLEVTLKPIKQ